MTQYMLSVIHDDEGLPNLPEEEIQRVLRRQSASSTTSSRPPAAGCSPAASSRSTAATVVDNAKGDTVITDGPYAEAKEQLGGFWIIEAADLDEALALAARGSAACTSPVEVRPFQAE